MKVGDRVAFSREWMRSTGTYVGEVGRLRGVITDGQDASGIVTIDRDTIERHNKANASNLVVESRIHLVAV